MEVFAIDTVSAHLNDWETAGGLLDSGRHFSLGQVSKHVEGSDAT